MALLARFLSRRDHRECQPRFAAAPLAPLRLERRRMLDAAAPGLVLETLPDVQPYVQVSENVNVAAESQELTDQVAQINAPILIQSPQATLRLRESEIPEDRSVLAVIAISDSSPMAHQISIDWGDGSSLQVIDVGPQQRDILAIHRYFDDNPSLTPADTYTIQAKITNAVGDEVTVSADVLVKNVAPNLDSLSITSPTDENGTATLTGTYSDPGTLDTHTLDIDWDGDGTFDESVSVSGGSFSVTRQIADDPAGLDDDSFNVNIRLRDDDGGEATGSVPLTVNNLNPQFTSLSITSPIVENGIATLSGTYTDAGTKDSHTLDIDWDGDGNYDRSVHVVNGSFRVSRQFLDDKFGPSDTFDVKVRLRDDDGGEALGAVTLTVENANPVLVLNPLATIDENGIAVLTGTYTDEGTLDTHTIDIDWDGDNVFDQTVVVSGGAFTVTQQFLDDKPASQSDTFNVTVRLRDDDGGEHVLQESLTVNNVNPTVVLVPPPVINENDVATLQGTISDVGSLDTFTLEINWGDPFSPPLTETFSLGTTALTEATDGINWDPATRTFSLGHRYLDDNPSFGQVNVYVITAIVTDDDGGSGQDATIIRVQNLDLMLQLTPDQLVQEGMILDLTGGQLGTFEDIGTQDTHTATIDWGDGSGIQSVVVDELNGSGTLSASHVYADNGTYTVTVTVIDDDGGEVTGTFQVMVENVDPALTFVNPDIVIDEGEEFTLAQLGVGLEDFGFDNLNNPLEPGGSMETFEALSVDWGDGSAATALSIGSRTNGGENVTTKATFLHDAHAYADNGVYTVSVVIRDDDGTFVTRSFEITVENVNPTLILNPTGRVLEINEGDTLDLFDLGTFTDPGFNTETFHYTINWGEEGAIDQENNLPDTVTNGQQGLLTRGTLNDSHKYYDNDNDNLYTITVTLFDDDGGFDQESIQVRVLNVNPSFVDVDPNSIKVIRATDVNTKGETVLTIQFFDPGTEKFFVPGGGDPFQVLIDWGDQLNEPDPDARFVIEDRITDNPTGPLTYRHKYAGPPDPNNPSGDITIRVKIRDDDFDTMTPLGAVGESDVADVTISQPGIGAEEPFRIDTTPQVPTLTFPIRNEVQLGQDNSSAVVNFQQESFIGGVSGEIRATTDRYVELRVIDAEGNLGLGYRLRPEVLEDLPRLFRSLPDNHYALYIVNTETNMRRLVLEVYVRNGKLIDPGDDSEGTRDRPPTEEQAIDPPGQEQFQEPAEETPAADRGALLDRQPPLDTGQWSWSRWSAVAMGLAASSSAKSWAYRVDEALAKATAQQWRKLQGHNPPKPKRP